ncbi:DUF488 domain-containing protein [Leucobacter denitrificans]|uniref:DUF488 family protein n=1 Tax=Leucobacter denitrificans TaxID=683042 RepID=A0A7G9S6F8_9MICO|nr:DUF488 family protein [Leucobacter denitrificans]QNN63433.1 DUF488 family protein [Leucobacter denitrificans]
MSTPEIAVARIYDSLGDASADSHTVRVLVDRLWPRGVSREQAAIDLWPKEVTPSNDLRKSWHADPQGHEPEHFEEFKASYREELQTDAAQDALAELATALREERSVLLLTAAKDPEVSHVPVIREALSDALRTS